MKALLLVEVLSISHQLGVAQPPAAATTPAGSDYSPIPQRKSMRAVITGKIRLIKITGGTRVRAV